MNHKIKILVFGITIFLTLAGLIYANINITIDKEDLKKISGTLDGEPQFKKGTRGRSFVQIKLREFGNQKFKTDDFSYHVLHKGLLRSEIEDGSKVNIFIRNEVSTSWVDNMNRKSDWYEIIALNDETNEYISLSYYNDYRRKDFWLSYVFWFVLLLAYLIWARRKKRTITAPTNQAAK